MPFTSGTLLNSRWLPRVAVLFLFLGVTALLISSLHRITYYPEADEGYYLQYMDYIHREGIQGFPHLFQDYLRDHRNWIYPTPIRIGFISASALAARIWGPQFLTLSYISLLSCGALILVNYYFLERHFG